MSTPAEAGRLADDASAVYAEFIAALVKGQEERKASIEQRGLAVITTSGALVTVLFGLVAVITESDGFEMPKQSSGPLAVALGALVCAGALALLTNAPLPFYKNFDPAPGLDEIFDHWTEPPADARLRVAATDGKVFRAAQTLNGIKANLLLAAMAAEVIGIGAVAVAVSEVISHS